MEIRDKLAIVTGVSKGIGLAVAKALLDEGAFVAGWSRSKPDLAHDRFHFFETDVTGFDHVQNSYEATCNHFGKDPVILVNNAGLGYNGKVEEIDMEKWHTMFDVNVHGLFYCTRTAVPAMKKAGEAHIINIASIAGLNGIEEMSGYVASKHAVRGISHSLMKELRNDGIKVTCVYPGSVETDFFNNITGSSGSSNKMRAEDVATTVVETLRTHPNYLIADVEMRPLQPKK
ncbi:SDR family oxidoreductase [Roseivirga sp. BDSF3-8]|uniref:SDR family oxidoreductase n=1 Tax=Roseivirga sp. BDSF3-8 TaxID=3241598 RepID=UPI003531FDC0